MLVTLISICMLLSQVKESEINHWCGSLNKINIFHILCMNRLLIRWYGWFRFTFFLWCLLKFLSRKGVYSPVNDIINYKKHWKQKSRSPINAISGCCLATAVNLISGQPIIFNHSVLLFWRTQHVSFAIDIHFFVSVNTIFKRRQPQLTDIQCW